MIVIDIRARETGIHHDELLALKREDHPDLSGGMNYIDSDRHTVYVEMETYVGYLASLRDRFEWADLDTKTYSSLMRTGAPDRT